eukprot:snap_masked-scaffold_51-processed-gene-0.21-mRNA-1 protein AED:1.00 eAED:1.00 QI:0/0/0/0/1/1/2/0/87
MRGASTDQPFGNMPSDLSYIDTVLKPSPGRGFEKKGSSVSWNKARDRRVSRISMVNSPVMPMGGRSFKMVNKNKNLFTKYNADTSNE